MILFRQGRPSQSTVSNIEIDVTLDVGLTQAARRLEHFAPWRPPIEVFETVGELVVRAELGGLSRTEVEVLVSGNELVIRGERSIAQPAGSCRYHESRVRYGPFKAVVRLPFPVAVESATADYIDGFLSVTLPRLAATRVPTQENGRAVEALQGDQ
jgi:HSP20 family protein